MTSRSLSLHSGGILLACIALIIDLHSRDLEFPHHENELAQSQAAACCCDKEHMRDGTDFVHIWVHNGFVNGELQLPE